MVPELHALNILTVTDAGAPRRDDQKRVTPTAVVRSMAHNVVTKRDVPAPAGMWRHSESSEPYLHDLGAGAAAGGEPRFVC